MSLDLLGENTSVALQSNWLTVDNNTLRADVLKNSKSEKQTVSAPELETILLLGRHSILQGIEEFYEQTVAKNRGLDIVRPSIWTVQLGTTAQTDGVHSGVFTERGYANGGINKAINEIKPKFHTHWGAVIEAGFLPEVRRTSTGRDGGAWLLFRKPELNELLHYWFGYEKNFINGAVDAILDKDKAVQKSYLHSYRTIVEGVVDEEPNAGRSRAQIGLILSMAAIKSAIGDKEGYEQEASDALTYAHNDVSIDMSTVRAIENATF
jgi:hypothetical protein